MKTHFLILMAVIIMTGCAQKKDDETGRLNHQRDSLLSVIDQKESSLNEFLATNTDIERNLDSIVARESAISIGLLKKSEFMPSMKDRINADIASINDLMKSSRKKIIELNKKLKSSSLKSNEYNRMIEHLNDRLNDKDKELMVLNDKLASLNMKVSNLESTVDMLTAENMEQSNTIDQQTTALHTAYYIVGKEKDLKDMKIISKTGGLLGIGRTSQIDPNIDNSKFIRIDYTKVNDIDLASLSAKIITAHPSDSYAMNKNHTTTNLIINDPEKFWSASKYLVVVKN